MRRNSLFLLLAILSCANAVAQTAFRYKRYVQDVKEEGWYSIGLPVDMFRDLNRDLTDLRLYAIGGNDTTEVPYLLRVLDDQLIEKQVALPLLNKSSRLGRLYLTFELQPSYKVNFLNLTFEERNYFGHVTIEGSEDRLEWFEIARDERIVSIEKTGNDYILSTLRFPVSSYRYLRLSVNADTDLTFRDASFAYDSIQPGSYHDVPIMWKPTPVRDTRSTTVDLAMEDYGPVSSISVDVNSERDYYRFFTLEYVSDSTRTQKGWIRSYRSLFKGHLTSFEENTFNFPVAFTRNLRLVIHDRDDSSLDIREISAKGPDVAIVGYLKPGDNFIFYGAGEMREPSYDLANFANRIPNDMPTAKLGPPEEILVEDGANPLFENPLWLWSVMGIMIVGLGFFTIKMMKSN